MTLDKTSAATTTTAPAAGFAALGLAEPLVKALAQKNYATPTPIQAQAIPHVLEGRDLLGIAQTGTGKTAAFALPILHRLAQNPKPTPRGGCRVLVLAPTRELAGQIADSFRAYGRWMTLSVEVVVGGVPVNRQKRRMERGADVLVATPGRLLDLVDQKALGLGWVEVLVLDEADQMLDLGFIHALRRIVPLVPRKRQTLFFSATMPKQIAELAASYLTNPAQVSVAPAATTAERVEQAALLVNGGEKPALLTHTLKTEDVDRALVFTRTKHGADKVVKKLAQDGIAAEAIHGNKNQNQRERALDAFRSGRSKVLVATDIAARGIDVPGVSHVVNYDMPNVPEQYVHRIGRTARAGREGLAISFVGEDERGYLRDIEKVTRQSVPRRPLPEGFAAPGPERAPEPQGRKSGGGRGGAPRGGRPGGAAPAAGRPAAPAASRPPRRRRGPRNAATQ